MLAKIVARGLTMSPRSVSVHSFCLSRKCRYSDVERRLQSKAGRGGALILTIWAFCTRVNSEESGEDVTPEEQKRDESPERENDLRYAPRQQIACSGIVIMTCVGPGQSSRHSDHTIPNLAATPGRSSPSFYSATMITYCYMKAISGNKTSGGKLS